VFTDSMPGLCLNISDVVEHSGRFRAESCCQADDPQMSLCLIVSCLSKIGFLMHHDCHYEKRRKHST